MRNEFLSQDKVDAPLKGVDGAATEENLMGEEHVK
jgi:hypothetical protein